MKLSRLPFRAFTLLELLIVISIIAILASFILVGVRGAKERAEAARCMANLRQIGSALTLFASDNNGNFPIAGSTIAWGNHDPVTLQASWAEQISEYIGTNSNLFRCQTGARNLAANKDFSYFLGARAAYRDAGGGFAALKMQRIAAPSKMILGGDSTYSGFTADDADKDDYSVAAPFSGAGPHDGKSHILFVDGSVRPYAEFEVGEMEVSYTNSAATY